MLNTMIVVAVTRFSGTTTPDKNGEVPIMLQCIAGVMPNRNVLSGTVAKIAGFEIGRTYLVNVRENGFDKVFGPDFTFTKVRELESGDDIVKTSKELGEPRIQMIPRPAGFVDQYRRKGDAVEGQRAKRIRAGEYEPALPTTIVDHRTAADVITGSSVNSGGQLLQNGNNRDNERDENDANRQPEFYGNDQLFPETEEMVRTRTEREKEGQRK